MRGLRLAGVCGIRFGGVDDRTAVLLISGESSARKVTGEALLIKEPGGWKVDGELATVALP